MSLKIPNSIRIGGTEYAVVNTPNLNDGINLAYGFVDYEKSLIHITSTTELSEDRKMETLLHEILHGIIYHRSMRVDGEEELVENLAKGLSQVLFDNWNRFTGSEEKYA